MYSLTGKSFLGVTGQFYIVVYAIFMEIKKLKWNKYVRFILNAEFFIFSLNYISRQWER